MSEQIKCRPEEKKKKSLDFSPWGPASNFRITWGQGLESGFSCPRTSTVAQNPNCVSTFLGLLFFSITVSLNAWFQNVDVDAHESTVGPRVPGRAVAASQAHFCLSLFPELAFPCTFWEGPSLLFSSHSPRLRLASRPRPSPRVQPAELSAVRRGQGWAHMFQSHGKPEKSAARGCGCLGWGWEAACLIPFFVVREEGFL